jgi:hypothetical protein
MATDYSRRKAGAEWRAIVDKNGTREFAAAFTANPVLDASVLNRTLVGNDAMGAFLAATARGMYDSLRFTTERVNGRKTYLEGKAACFAGMWNDHPHARRGGPYRKQPPLPSTTSNRGRILKRTCKAPEGQGRSRPSRRG